MQGIYYLAMLFGVCWLAVWSILPEHVARRFWSPFDMREDEGGAVTERRPVAGGPVSRRRHHKGEDPAPAASRSAPDPSSDLATARSWRARREQADPSQRGT